MGKRRRSRRIESRNEYILKRVLIILGCIFAVGVILVAAVKIVTIVGRNRLVKNANTEGPNLTEESNAAVISDPVYASDWQEGWVSLDGKVYERSWEPEMSVYKWFCEQDKKTDAEKNTENSG